MKEIERKFLVKGQYPTDGLDCPIRITQGYVKTVSDKMQVRVRISKTDFYEVASVAIKSPPRGKVRTEIETPIPVETAQTLLAQCDHVLTKTRHKVVEGNHMWDIDEFDTGLVVAEVELDEENEDFIKPSWLGDEVTGNPIYSTDKIAGIKDE